MEEEKSQITLKEWRKYALGEFVRGYKTDTFYCSLANEIFDILKPESGKDYLPSEKLDVLCVRLSQYVEDIASGLGIFKAFRNISQSFDRRTIPFYNGDGKFFLKYPSTDYNPDFDKYDQAYDPKKVNVDDVRLLLWDYVMAMTFTAKKDVFSPYNYNLLRLAHKLKVVMDKALEGAPANSDLLELLYPKRKFASYEELKERLYWMCRGCYMSVSYHYDKEYEAMVELIKDAESSMKTKRRFKYNASQTRKNFIENLIFERTTRFYSLPYHHFYSQMLKDNGIKRNAELAQNLDGLISQEYKVRKVENKQIQLQSVDAKYYDLEMSEEFLSEVDRPGELRFVMCILIQYDGQWQMSSIRNYSYNADYFFIGNDGWNEDMSMCLKMLQQGKETYEGVHRVQKGKIIKFYKNIEVLVIKVMEDVQQKRLETLKSLRDYEPDLFKKRHLTQQINEVLQQLKELSKIKPSVMTKSPVKQVVAVLHPEDDTVTVYREYAQILHTQENPYAKPHRVYEGSIEYIILHDFDFETAILTLIDPSIKTIENNFTQNLTEVRKFLVENPRFMARYCYHESFTGKRTNPYNYAPQSVFVV